MIIDAYEKFIASENSPFAEFIDKKILRIFGGIGLMIMLMIAAVALLIISPILFALDVIALLLEIPIYYYNKREQKMFKERAVQIVNEYCYENKEIHRFRGFEGGISFSLENFLRNILFFRNELTETENMLGEIVCTRDKRRSLKDIYFLCRTYVDKDVEPVEILRILMKLVNERKLGVQRCMDIGKIVFTTQSMHVNKVGFVEYGEIAGKPVSLKMLEEAL